MNNDTPEIKSQFGIKSNIWILILLIVFLFSLGVPATGIHLYTGIVILVLSVIFWLKFIRKYDRFEPESAKEMLKVFLVGGLLSVIVAGCYNSLLGIYVDGGIKEMLKYRADSSSTIPLSNKVLIIYALAFIEEFFKSFFTYRLIRKNPHVNEAIDPLIYSVTVALGFSIFENINYFLDNGAVTLTIRTFTSVPLHMAVAIIWGWGFAKNRLNGGQITYLNVLPYVLVAAFIHATWNSLLSYFGLWGFVINIFMLWYCFGVAQKMVAHLETKSQFK